VPAEYSQKGTLRTSTRALGLRSLSGRLVLLLLLPLLVAQVLVFRDLQRLRSAAADSTELSHNIGTMALASAVYAPAAFEEMTSSGLAVVDGLGFERSLLAGVLGFDYEPHLAKARANLDLALDNLSAGSGATKLKGGQTVHDRLVLLRRDLAEQRLSLDQHATTGPKISLRLNAVITMVDELASTKDEIDSSSSDVTVVALSDEAAHLLSMVQAVARETRANASSLGASNGSTEPGDALRAAGVAGFTIAEYETLVVNRGGDDARTRWTKFRSGNALSGFETLRPEIAKALVARQNLDPAGNALLEDPAFIRLLAQVLRSSFDRLDAFQQFGEEHFADATKRTTSIGKQAHRAVENWIVLMALCTLISAVLLGLTLWTTVRPLQRLTLRALDVGRGEISPEPLPLSGPSDVRAVTSTFNSMVSTLATFERQLAELATGDHQVHDEVMVPGSLGTSLRASVLHLSDVTAQLRASEAMATAIIDTANDAIWTVDESGRVLSANAAAEQLLARTAGHQIGRALGELFGRPVNAFGTSSELEFRRHDGKLIHALISHSEVLVNGRLVRALFAKDVSERKGFEERLAFQARHDQLTGLPNRLAAIERLDSALERAKQSGQTVGVAFIDLDGFKAVNDSRGHASGDQLLREVARRLRTGLRNSEFVSRLGGDEFLMIVEGLETESITALTERLIISIGQPFEHGDDLFVISASAGIAVCKDACDGMELIRQADLAVYEAKSLGRGRSVVFDESLQEVVEANAEVEVALRRAIRDNELELHFQPIVRLATNSAWGAEALVRWNRPGIGQVPPDRFIPVAERSNLIIDLGRWVITAALRTLAEWQQDPARAHLHIAVNVSGRHLTNGDLVADLSAALAETGANPTGLEIELTETHLLEDLDRANAVLRTVRSWGIDVAVDDFGTGYSSMGYLRQLEVDAIKIDRIFVARTQHPGYDRTIVEVLLQLADTLNLDVVAEGVETQEQLAFLQSRNCGRAQGYYLSRPIPRTDLDQWLLIHADDVVQTFG
jgi:diguanylate cyclase (GGDEF)-like protein/PAS domain S-box-containing protein